MKVIKVLMNEDLLKRLSREAKTRKLARAALIREACQQHLEKHNEEELDRQYVEGYRQKPESAAWGKLGEKMASEVWGEEIVFGRVPP
jgi:hypothetical protein